MGRRFDPDLLAAIAADCADVPFDEMVDRVTARLQAAYPGLVHDDRPWLFNRAAGATGMMKLVHGSLTEYVLIFGSAIGTEGHSGRYWMDVYDFMLAGVQYTYTEEEPGRAVRTVPPDHVYLPRRTAKGYRIEGDTWMLEYGRGAIATAIPIGVADTLWSSHDWRTFWKTLWHYGVLVLRSLRRGKL